MKTKLADLWAWLWGALRLGKIDEKQPPPKP